LRGNSDYEPSGESGLGKRYEKVFIRRVHELLVMGYDTLTPNEFSDAQEEDITGELVRAIDSVLDNPKTPPWTDSFSIHEEPRIHAPDRKGKRRRRLDIRIDSSEIRPRSRLRFEAKRLGPNHGVSKYLGTDGLQCFIDGRYARDDSRGGMLGYVQEGTCKAWAQKIGTSFGKKTKQLCLTKTGSWRSASITDKVPCTYRSEHSRPNLGHPIEIIHTLLSFN
jgi:hypothetical protein